VLDQSVASEILAKVGPLVKQRLSITNPTGVTLASELPLPPTAINLADIPWAVTFSHNGQVAGWVVAEQPLAAQAEIAPLIRQIAELVMNQAIVLEQVPQDEELFDQFIYDLLYQLRPDAQELETRARLFHLDPNLARVVLALHINDPALDAAGKASASDRQLRIGRYKFSIRRALDSYYTESRPNLVAYLGGHLFVILKTLPGGEQLQAGLEAFVGSLSTIHQVLKSELRAPTTIGVGDFHPGLAGLRQSFHEAQNAIELGQQQWNWDGDRLYHIDDFGMMAPLLTGVDEHNIGFSRDLLDRLSEHNDMLTTLTTFFDHNLSLTSTAAALQIHRNTLVYRLDRIGELLGLDPRRFNEAAQIKLAILYGRFVGLQP